jgi:hypothetical protein
MRIPRSPLLLSALGVTLLVGGCTAGRPVTLPEEPAAPPAAAEPMRLTAIPDLAGLPPAVTGPQTVAADTAAADVLVAHDRVWVLSSGRLDVYDLRLNLLGQVPVGSPIERVSAGQVLGAGGGSVWAGFDVSDTLYRIDPDAYRVTAAIAAVDNPSRMAALGDDLWVAQDRTGDLTKIDLRSNRVVDVVPVHTSAPLPASGWGQHRHQERTLGPARLGTTGRLVWVEEPADSHIVAVDTRTGSVVARHDCRGLSVDGGAATATCGREVVWFDPTTAAATRRHAAPEWLGSGPLNILGTDPAGGWIAAPQDMGVVRVDSGLRPTAATGLTLRTAATRMTILGDAIIAITGSTIFRLDLC